MAAILRAEPGAALAPFLDEAAARPFQWGVHDCALLLADWGCALTGIDAAAHLRGRYTTALGCARLLKRAGGLGAVVHHCAALIGFALRDGPARTGPAATGDVGVIAVRTAAGVEPAGAICAGGDRWAVLAATGVIVAPATPLFAWGP